jgi:1-phosphatidylinositol-4-phosphate 5-kinase
VNSLKNVISDAGTALKDQDFIERKERFKLEFMDKKLLMQQLSRDTQFFIENRIIDYSLLVGIHDIPEGTYMSDS